MEEIRVEDLNNREIEQLINEGKLTRDEVDERLQQAAKREAAERRPDELPDDSERHTAGGFGSGQGMGNQRTGSGPDRQGERGEPRTDDPEWPT